MNQAPSRRAALNATLLSIALAMGLATDANAGIDFAKVAKIKVPGSGEFYSGVGFPGLMAGYGRTFSPRFGLRADFATLGHISHDVTESGVDYKGKLQFSRVGLFADYFPLEGGFRLTGGVTLNRQRLRLVSQLQAGQTYVVGGQSVTAQQGDQIDVRIRMPTATPYLGMGWGHQAGGSGTGFVADLGLSIGRAEVEIDATGPQLGDRSVVTQGNLNEAARQLREGVVGKVQFIPQISAGLNYRF